MAFQKGVSGNPNGRPKKIKRLTRDALVDFGNRPCPIKGYTKKTYNEALVEALYKKAIAGNAAALNQLLARLIGPMPQAMNIASLSTEQILEAYEALRASQPQDALPDDSITVDSMGEGEEDERETESDTE